MNKNVIKQLIDKIEKRNFNKKKTRNQKPMNKIFKTKNTKKIKLWNDISEILYSTKKDNSYETFINSKKK
tara:strand:+ start:6205 stop:6414 length:210 start_codon:yes stop_codon:yes gene_type:complete